MSKMTPDEKAAAAKMVAEEMKKHTLPRISGIYGVESRDKGYLVGTGTFIALKDRTWLLTAAHVLLENLGYEHRAHSTSYGAPPVVFSSPFCVMPPPLDLAFVPIDKDVVRSHNIQSWPADMLDADSLGIERDMLYVHGYPGDQSRWVPINPGGIHSTSLPFWTTDAKSSWPEFDPSIHIAIAYPRNGWFGENGESISMPLPDGLSGSALWRTATNRIKISDWSPNSSRIIGVIQRWDRQCESLVATKIEVVRQRLLHELL